MHRVTRFCTNKWEMKGGERYSDWKNTLATEMQTGSLNVLKCLRNLKVLNGDDLAAEPVFPNPDDFAPGVTTM